MAGRRAAGALELEGEPAIAATVPGRAERPRQRPEAHPLIKMAGSIHAGEGFEVADLIAEAARDAQALPQKHRAHAVTARRAQKIHLAQLAHLKRRARKRGNAPAAHDLAGSL